MNDNTGLMKKHGLFAAPLNSGKWMVGKASYIYQLSVGMDHFDDENLSIGDTLAEALVKWCNKNWEAAG